MKVIKQLKQHTLLGYHNKNLNQYGVLEDSQLPILTEEDYSPFLVTRDHNFTISTKQIKTLINNFEVINSFRKKKRTLAILLIIPGVLISFLFLLRILGVLEQGILSSLAQSRVALTFFWISVLGALIIWHDYYRYKSHPIKLPEAHVIPRKEIENIKEDGFKFARYVQLSSINFLSEEARELFSKYNEDGYVRTLNLFTELLSDPDIQEILKRANLKLKSSDFEKYSINKETIPDYPLSALRSLIAFATEDALLTESSEIKPEHLFITMLRVFPVMRNYLKKNNSSYEIIREIYHYYVNQESKREAANPLDPRNPYHPKGGIGKYWIYGYTFHLNKFSKDLIEKMAGEQDKFGIGHEEEIEQLISILGRISQKNVLLIGEAGVGKSSLIKGLAQSIIRGTVPQQLKNKRVIQLDITSLLALGSANDNLEQLIQKSMKELGKAGNTILYIDEIQEIIPAKSGETKTSIASIMLPYILESKFPIIGTINYADYKKYFYSNESLRSSFENVEVSELTPYETLQIMQTKIPQLEQAYEMYITFPALSAAIELSQRYINNRKLPDSALRTLEASCSWAQTQQIKVLNNEHIAKYISIQTDIPVESISTEEADKLMSLEERIRQRVIGQDEAVHKVVETLKRSRTDIRDPNKPIGVFLFMGPTGVGKTHLAKIISQEYFGGKSGKEDMSTSKKELIKVDMSEYKNLNSIDKILGQTGSDNVLGQASVSLLDKVKENPFSVLLFDEIEKAHPQVLDLFLQLFDEGRLTSNKGETIDFTNTIIISTSNIGSKLLLDALNKEKTLWKEAKERAIIELRQALRPELINRFDEVIVFSPHTKQNLVKISQILLEQLAKRLKDKGLELEWKNTIPVLIAENAYQPGFGARPLQRYIQEKIEGRVATEMLEGNVSTGDKVNIKGEWLT